MIVKLIAFLSGFTARDPGSARNATTDSKKFSRELVFTTTTNAIEFTN